MKKTENEMKILGMQQEKVLSSSEIASRKKSFVSYFKKNTKAAQEYREEVAALEKQLESMSTKADASKFDTDFKNLQTKAISEGNTGKSFFHELGRGFKQIGQFAYTYGAIQRIPEVIREMYQAVLDVDTAMTNLYKVTDETDAKYEEFLNNAGNTAKELGRNISSYIEQASTWAKLGYSIDQSSELAKVSSIYSNVGEVDDETAVSDLVTVMKAYNISADDAITVVDKYNKLGNEFATSAKDLGEGMSNAASMLSLGGTDVNKALALLTGGSEITQSAGELGNALKIGQMHVQGMKGDLEKLGEEVDENVESISKMQTHILNLTEGKVNIFDDNKNFRDYYNILEDVSEIIDDISSTDRADLLETLFGKNRANQGAAVIQAFQSGQVQKAYQATLNAEGSAQAEQSRWKESMQAKIQEFQAQFQELSQVVLDSDFLKGLIDGGTDLLGVLTQVIDKFGILKTLFTTIGGGWLTKNGFGKRDAALYKIKQNNRRFINVESSITQYGQTMIA